MRRALAGITALVLGVGALALGTTSANAAPEDHVKIELYSGGTLLTDGATVHEGQPLTMRIDYTYVPSESLAGQTVVFDFSGLDLDLDDFDLTGNDAVESVVISGNTVTVKFVDTWPQGVTTGYIEADFEITGVDQSGEETLSWDINGEDGGTIQLIVVEESDETPDLDDAADKEVGTPNTGGATPTDVNLNSFVVMGPDGSGATEFKSLDCDALNGTVVPYTLTLEIADGTTRADYTITDALPAGLDFVPTSLSATRTFWDSNGVNKQTVAYTDGVATPTAAGFTYTIPADSPVEGPAIITVDFDAVFNLSASECTDLENQLRTAYQNLRDGDAGSGNFNVRLRNTATFPTIGDRHGDLYIGGNVPGPGVGTAFGKADDLGDFYVVTDDDGLILQHGSPLVDGPVDVNYTLRANLGGWTGADADHTLQRNVVITDTLPTTANWNTGHTNFITTTGNIVLAVIPCPADISMNTYVGNYCVDGQTFRANIGQSNTTNGTIVLKAQLHHVDAVSGMQQMTGNDGSTVQGGERWRLRNTANFAYRTTGNGYNATSDLFPNVLPDNHEEGINDTAAFLKNSPASVSVGQGESAVIPFTLRVDTAKTGISLADSRIVDEVDHSVFDLGDDLSGVTISGTYVVGGTTVNLNADDFELTLDGEDLVIVLSDAGIGKTDPAGAGGVLTVNLGLRTHVLEGKSTLEVTNHARLLGGVGDHEFWSERSASATSFGNEAEARKFIYDPRTDGFGREVVVETDDEGNLPADNNVFIYQLRYIGHGTYTSSTLPVLVDSLPAGTEFVGFLQPGQFDDPVGNAVGGPIDAGGNLDAAHVPGADADDPGTVTLSLRAGESFSYRSSAEIYFALRVPQATGDVVNSFQGQTATIRTHGTPSIDIEKWTEDGGEPVYDETGHLLNDGKYTGDHDKAPGKKLTAGKEQQIRFTVSNDGGEDLIDIKVSDELTSGKGKIKDLRCEFPDDTVGTEWDGPFAPGDRFECTGTLPALKAGQKHADTAKVTAVGALSGTVVDDDDLWNGRVPTALETTGGQALTGAAVLAVLGILGGGLLMLKRRKSATGA